MQDFIPVSVLLPSTGVASIPLVFDSPHSGQHYPPDFAYACAFAHLRKAEDTDVDDLYSFAPALGGTLVAAEFPRSYIDPNRRVEDIDTSMINGDWPGPVDHSPKTKSGIGLIWRVLDDNSPIYARTLSVAEVSSALSVATGRTGLRSPTPSSPPVWRMAAWFMSIAIRCQRSPERSRG